MVQVFHLWAFCHICPDLNTVTRSPAKFRKGLKVYFCLCRSVLLMRRIHHFQRHHCDSQAGLERCSCVGWANGWESRPEQGQMHLWETLAAASMTLYPLTIRGQRARGHLHPSINCSLQLHMWVTMRPRRGCRRRHMYPPITLYSKCQS